jgi:tRNA/rRNA methyltransferase
MLNFGLTELRVVDPVCNITSDNAIALSTRSADILRNARIYSNLSDAISDLQRVYATTVRLRDMTQKIYTPRAAAHEILSSISPDSPSDLPSGPPVRAGILFGRERNGLYNEEVALADSIITIPSFKHFSSLNLAQAVNIIGYELWVRRNEVESSLPPPVW